MLVRTPLETCRRKCEALASRLPTLSGGGFSFRSRPDRGQVHLVARGWAMVDVPGGAVVSPVDIYAGRISDDREFWRVHDTFTAVGQAAPELVTFQDMLDAEERAREADQASEKEDYLRWLLGEKRSYGAYSVRRS